MKWGLIIFLAVFLGVVVLGIYAFRRIRGKIRAFSRMAFGTSSLIDGFKSVQEEYETTPRSLNGCDSILLPRILEDFPDFDAALAKTYAREALRKFLSGKPGVTIHNVVFSDYKPAAVTKTVVMQAAVQFRLDGHRQQKRYILNYAYLIQGRSGEHTAAGNCPNCGGVISFGQTHCAYCGSQLAAIMKGAWEFTEIREG